MLLTEVTTYVKRKAFRGIGSCTTPSYQAWNLFRGSSGEIARVIPQDWELEARTRYGFALATISAVTIPLHTV